PPRVQAAVAQSYDLAYGESPGRLHQRARVEHVVPGGAGRWPVDPRTNDGESFGAPVGRALRPATRRPDQSGEAELRVHLDDGVLASRAHRRVHLADLG